MNENSRVKMIRKELNLTLEKFGEKLGVTKTAISNIERGERKLTEQMKRSICREFRVSYAWLTDGVGEMFNNSDAALKDKLDQIMEGSSEFHKELLKNVLELEDDELIIFEKFFSKFLKNYKQGE